MNPPIVVRNVVLTGDDLNMSRSPWRRLNAANNERLIPIALGFLVSSAAIGSMLDPSLVQLLWFVGPIATGWFLFIWLTNAHFLGAYKSAYQTTPLGSSPCTFTFDDQGLHQTTRLSEHMIKWEAFVEVAANEKGFRFWMTPFMAVFLPSRFLQEGQGGALKDLIASARAQGRIKGLQD